MGYYRSEWHQIHYQNHGILRPYRNYSIVFPQHHFKEHVDGRLVMDHTNLELFLPNTSVKLSFPFNSGSNLPYMLPTKHPHFIKALFGHFSTSGIPDDILRDTQLLETFDPVTSLDEMCILLAGDTTSNLNSAQHELRLLQNKVGHVGMKRIQQLVHHDKPLDSALSEGELNHPIVFRSEFAKNCTCVIPFCKACALSKMTKQPTGTQHIVHH